MFVKVLKYYTDADKNPRPWRDFCRDQPLFDHARVDTLAPVSIFVGVLTYDKAGARRQAIRDTWGRSLHPSAGNNVQLMFVMGRPEGEPGERAKVEAERE